MLLFCLSPSTRDEARMPARPSRPRIDLSRKKLQKLAPKLAELLRRADDLSFLQLAWAVNGIQSNMLTSDAKRFIQGPPEAVTSDISSPYFIYKWEIETFVTLLLALPKEPNLSPRGDVDCRKYGTLAYGANLLRKIEDAETGLLITADNILLEMPRIAYRQFGWQRGYFNSERMYRYHFVYGQGLCAEYFKSAHGLSIEDFALACVQLLVTLFRRPWITRDIQDNPFGIAPNAMALTLKMISRQLPEMREETIKLLGDHKDIVTRSSYLPSSLRRFPIIESPRNGSIISPLPELIAFRATAGLYYDIRGGGQAVINDANHRFEKYCRMIIKARCPRLEALETEKYGSRKASFETPDVLIKDRGEVVAVLECKAAKVTFAAQYAEDPLTQGRQTVEQIIKGIVQLWRFFSHVRRGIYSSQPVAADAPAVIVTMEQWGVASNTLQASCLAEALKRVEGDTDIAEEDKKQVVFTSVESLDDVLATSDDDKILAILRKATELKYAGWTLDGVRDNCKIEKSERKRYPFNIRELLPGWERLAPRAPRTSA